MKKVPHTISVIASFVLVALILLAYLVSHSPKQASLPAAADASAAPSQNNAVSSVPLFTTPLTIGDTQMEVALATTPEEQAQGLSDTAPLGADEGMLFVFPSLNSIPFWMQDMNYPLDIIWIGSDKTVVDITPDLAPDTYPRTYSSKVPDQYVLEVPSGFAVANHVMIGERVSF